MKEYIDRQKALEIIKITNGDYATAFTEIKRLKAEDVACATCCAEWITEETQRGDVTCCSSCGHESNATPYCPSCGAKMERIIPKKQYPTWREWLNNTFPNAMYKDFCPGTLLPSADLSCRSLDVCDRCRDTPIREYIAKQLGITPIR